MTADAGTPLVSVVVPARNEARHIDACVRSILAQDADGGLEVIVVDGASSDSTAELARAAGARVVDNPAGITPAALNRGLAAARGRILVRFDAHAEMPAGYVKACVEALAQEPGAVNVGGWRKVRADGPWGRAVGAALASRFGVGNPRIWRAPKTGAGRCDVDTVPLGCWPRDALAEAGGWDEAYIRNQDFELNFRLRSRGGRVVFDPRIWSIYHPRESLRALVSQYWDYGRFKALMLRRAPDSLRPRQLAPVALLFAMAAAAVPQPVALPARAAVAAYALLLAGLAIRTRAGWRLAPVLTAMHVVWALGLLRGLVALPRPSRGAPGPVGAAEP